MPHDLSRRRLIRWVAAATVAGACGAFPAIAAEVQYPVGSSIGLAPPPGLRLGGTAPGFHDPDNKVSILMLELPRSAYVPVESSMTTAAAKDRGIVVDRRETLFTEAGTAVLSAGDDTRENMRRWMLVALLPKFTALVSVQIPDAARDLYPDEAIRTALASLTTRATPIGEQLGLLPYRVEDLAGFRVVTVLNRSTVILTDGPRDDLHAVEQPHVVIGIAPGGAGQTNDRTRLAQAAFNNLPGFADRRVTASEMIRVEGHPAHEIRADARDAMTGAPVMVVQWLRFGQNAYMHIVGVTLKDNWGRDFPRFRTVRDGIRPKR
ncbi:MAG: hypothetical protein GEU91_19445 [Rhizobiales bacterium]|nr:hypothetical protein [Hyphomicrobiales bacterium]